MTEYYPEVFLLQTVLQVDHEISNLEKRLSEDMYLEVGDDPRLVREIETELLAITGMVRKLQSQFNLAVVPLSKANRYFSLTRHVTEALAFVRKVQQKDYGCRAHTDELLSRLKACSNSVREMDELISINTGIRQ